jgi:hypothetical protein
MADGNAALRTRGLLVFGLVAVIAAGVLLVILRLPSQATPQAPPEGVTPSAPGWEIRYQATVTLARRGSDKVPLETLREMLDEQQQLRNCVTKLQDGREVSNEAAARTNVISALKAIVEWNKSDAAARARKERPEEVERLFEAIDKLRESPNAPLRAEVEKAREALGRKA